MVLPSGASYITILIFVLLEFTFASNNSSNALLCSKCGHPITYSNDLINVPSDRAIRSRNETLLDRSLLLIQTFKNTHGFLFELISTLAADVFKFDEGSSEETWYPGYLWHVIACPRCGYHLGWFFSPDVTSKKKKSFFSLILDRLLHENYADRLIVSPKHQEL